MLKWLQALRRKSKNNGSATLTKEIDCSRLQQKLEYFFNDLQLLEKALKHRSILPSLHQKRVDSNERLELLGDAVLGLVVTEYLYKKYPAKDEGELTAMKSLLVSRKILARMANAIDLGQFLLLSDAEKRSGGRNRQSITADAYEAVIGAIYLDGGLGPARRFIRKSLLKFSEKIMKEDQLKNFKSMLLEYAQSKNLGAPYYITRSEEGPDHRKVFTVEVRIQNRTMGVGVGNSKKKAEQKAAQDAISQLDI